MGQVIEFFTSDDEVWYQTEDGIDKLDEKSELVSLMFDRIQQLYPEAFNALRQCYAKSASNISYFKYLCVRRFVKCNFGSLDMTRRDINVDSRFNFEHVCCPLRKECQYEGCICNPKFDTSISDAEMRVMKLMYEGMDVNDIAKELFISPNTVKNHKKSVYLKLGIHTNVEFIKYANDNNLFTN